MLRRRPDHPAQARRTGTAIPLVVIFAILATFVTSTSHARIALVIGNGQYASAPLNNPVNDANDVSKRLRELGFQVNVLINASRREMRRAIRDHSENLRSSGEVGLFYYAGHGMQIKGVNYLIPTDAVMQSEFEIPDEAVSANSVLRALEEAGNDLNIVILDACRDNPFASSYRSASTRGLARMDAPGGSLIAYATAPGNTALDGAGRNGVYTKHLLANLDKQGMPIEQMFKKVRIGVIDESAGQQTPWEESSLRSDFFFAPASVTEATVPAKTIQQPATEVAVVQVAPSATPVSVQPATPLAQLLDRGDAAFADNRLSAPRGDNAVLYYLQALDIDGSNARARTGLQQIARRYIALGDRALMDQDYRRAQLFATRGLEVAPGDARLIDIMKSAEEGQLQQNLLAARQEQVQPEQAPQPVAETEVAEPVAAPTDVALVSGPVDSKPTPGIVSTSEGEPSAIPEDSVRPIPGLERPGKQKRADSGAEEENPQEVAKNTSKVTREIRKDVDQFTASLSGFGNTLKRGFKEIMRAKKKTRHQNR